ncbi:hypothetical protein SRABI26_01084 [Arthrobacter sp. Bi26]|nr:hypothetical protein SRABI26_01084 [Arthrobacter sp. Bi26]
MAPAETPFEAVHFDAATGTVQRRNSRISHWPSARDMPSRRCWRLKRRTGSRRFTSLARMTDALMVRTTASTPASATAASTPSNIPVKMAETVVGGRTAVAFPERATSDRMAAAKIHTVNAAMASRSNWRVQ